MKTIAVETLFKDKKEEFSLEIVAGEKFLRDQKISTYDIFRPGLALAGYTGRFLSERVIIIGETEIAYLETLPKHLANRRIATVMRLGTPCIIVAKKLNLSDKFKEEAKRRKIPILRTPMSTTPFIHKLSTYLEYKLATKRFVQGTLVDIYGVGVLFVGKPGTGKSECALDLIERGHRFVADDLVKIVQRGDILVGSGAEKSPRLKHHIEVRGVGLVDIFRIFGVKSVRLRKRIEIILELVLWDEVKGDFERVGIEAKTRKILDIEIPRIVIPLTPGKNVSVIAEVVAMNYLLKLRGIQPAEEYNEELKRILAQMEAPSSHYDEEIE
jgi:HPr kinase/phosphorylase